jgi:hypothetical protein
MPKYTNRWKVGGSFSGGYGKPAGPTVFWPGGTPPPTPKSTVESAQDVAQYINGKAVFGHTKVMCDYRPDIQEFLFRCTECKTNWTIANEDLVNHGFDGWKVPPCVPGDYELSTPFELLRRVWKHLRTGTPDPNLLACIYACLREADELGEDE